MRISIRDFRLDHAISFNLQQHLTLFRGVEGANPALRSLYLFLLPIRQSLTNPRFPPEVPAKLDHYTQRCIQALPPASQALDPISVSELVAHLLQEALEHALVPRWEQAFAAGPDHLAEGDTTVQWQDQHFRYHLKFSPWLPASFSLQGLSQNCTLRYCPDQEGWFIDWAGRSLFYPGHHQFPWQCWLRDALQVWLKQWEPTLPAMHYIPADRAALGHLVLPKLQLFRLMFPLDKMLAPQIPRVVQHFFARIHPSQERDPLATTAYTEISKLTRGRIAWCEDEDKLWYFPDKGTNREAYQPNSLLPWDLYLLTVYCQWVVRPGDMLLLEAPYQGCPPALQTRLTQLLLQLSQQNPLLLSTTRTLAWRWVRRFLREDRLNPSHIRVVTAGGPPAKRLWQPSSTGHLLDSQELFASP